MHSCPGVIEVRFYPGESCFKWLPFFVLKNRQFSGKDSACNAGAAGGAGLVPGYGRFPGGGHGKPLQ